MKWPATAVTAASLGYGTEHQTAVLACMKANWPERKLGRIPKRHNTLLISYHTLGESTTSLNERLSRLIVSLNTPNTIKVDFVSWVGDELYEGIYLGPTPSTTNIYDIEPFKTDISAYTLVLETR